MMLSINLFVWSRQTRKLSMLIRLSNIVDKVLEYFLLTDSLDFLEKLGFRKCQIGFKINIKDRFAMTFLIK